MRSQRKLYTLRIFPHVWDMWCRMSGTVYAVIKKGDREVVRADVTDFSNLRNFWEEYKTTEGDLWLENPEIAGA